MLRIRLARVGSRGNPHYRVVVIDARSPQGSDYVDRLGYYNPQTDPATIVLDGAKVTSWLQKGAQPSETVAKLLRRQGILPKG
ncbi:MAG: 30S ribosomal protein S16 [Chloroflexi bacterium]|nr:30S ribosomal protein S16 [Chloroflexota bacterium]